MPLGSNWSGSPSSAEELASDERIHPPRFAGGLVVTVVGAVDEDSDEGCDARASASFASTLISRIQPPAAAEVGKETHSSSRR